MKIDARYPDSATMRDDAALRRWGEEHPELLTQGMRIFWPLYSGFYRRLCAVQMRECYPEGYDRMGGE